MLLGAHMSISGGLENSLKMGETVGWDTIQIFTKNNNQWKAKPITQEQIDLFLSIQKEKKITPVFAHASYLINIASPDAFLFNRSREALLEELTRCEQLGLAFLVLHPGAHRDSGEKTGIARAASALNWVFSKTKKFKVLLLIENAAGQGSCIGHSFEHLAGIIKGVTDKKRMGVCFDTCHAFAAGYDIRTKTGYQETFKKFDKIVGLTTIKAFHLNDSKKEFHSRVDRHEHIGKGHIGKTAFQLLMNDKRFEKIPMVLETPKGKECLEDKQNLRLLRNLIKK